jgi:hypothetical protein
MGARRPSSPRAERVPGWHGGKRIEAPIPAASPGVRRARGLFDHRLAWRLPELQVRIDHKIRRG